MSGLNWNRRKPVFRAWYEAEVMPWDTRVLKEEQPRPRRSPAKSLPKPSSLVEAVQPPKVAAGAFAGKPVLRTSDPVKAREALAGAVEAMVWCDGGCAPTNPGTMGMGVVILAEGARVELYAGGGRGTNNSAEVSAAILALEAIPNGCRATVIADSTYLVDGIAKWCSGWRQRDFKRGGADIPNAALWRQLDALAAVRPIKWRWQRGHCGDAGNELADRLARLGRAAR